MIESNKKGMTKFRVALTYKQYDGEQGVTTAILYANSEKEEDIIKEYKKINTLARKVTVDKVSIIGN